MICTRSLKVTTGRGSSTAIRSGKPYANFIYWGGSTGKGHKPGQGGSGSVKWRQIGGAEFPSGVTLEPLNILYPLGAGPSSQSTTRNVFRLPANYLRKAPQDPKAGAYTWLGAPTNRMYDDWDIQDQYIVSSDTSPIIFRFVADFTSVRDMSAMFCEMLAARCALAVCEVVTQSTEKMRTIAGEYDKFGKEARTVNAIEIGPIESDLDEYLACRY